MQGSVRLQRSSGSNTQTLTFNSFSGIQYKQSEQQQLCGSVTSGKQTAYYADESLARAVFTGSSVFLLLCLHGWRVVLQLLQVEKPTEVTIVS